MKIYLNLTNGIEWLKDLPIKNSVGYCRIQSTKCEQKDWSYIIEDLEYQLLLDIALGKEVVVLDCGARKEVSRAVYQGVQWITYVLNKRWLNKDIQVFVNKTNVSKYFESCYTVLSRRAKNKLDYIKKFLITDEISLTGISKSTEIDSKYDEYTSILKGINIYEYDKVNQE